MRQKLHSAKKEKIARNCFLLNDEIELSLAIDLTPFQS